MGDPRVPIPVQLAHQAFGQRRALPAPGAPAIPSRAALPLLTYTEPRAVAEALRWRQSTLPAARERANQLGLSGAAFPWRTIEGSEGSAYWPAGTAAFHVNADIADAVTRYTAATGDLDFERDTGVELLVETARLWRSLGHHDHQGVFHIDGVTGPDEYSAVADDNAYTNLMARQNLLDAAEAVRAPPRGGRAARRGRGGERRLAGRRRGHVRAVQRRTRRARAARGLHPLPALGLRRHPARPVPVVAELPLLRPLPQTGRQTGGPGTGDVHLRQPVRDEEQIARNFAYYEPLTVRDSSLSACCQAVIAAQAGHLRLAYDYTAEAALMDLADLEHNTRDGLHIASLAGTWMALVAGFGGMRRDGDTLRFAPRLPEQFSRLAFSLQILGRRLRVEITPEKATYTLLSGPPLTIGHHGEPLTVSADGPAVRMVPATPDRPAPRQPPHRGPNAR
ncbi:Putative glycosyl hydrolase OS=Streptomyces glaucescens OX=1907 GN=SGLAU_30250 PE=3 SV=1 [Streptomyces glaucescens]